MSVRFILRFDDITPQMSWSKFLPLKNLIEELGIKSVLGVVPESMDPELSVEPKRDDFFDLVRGWSNIGDTIAQHGTHHFYDSSCSGILRINNRSEFAGHPYNLQLNKIKKGKKILVKEGVWQPYFMAPAHSFDYNTINALSALGFHAITDGYGFYPYKINSMLLVPQMSSFPLKSGIGLSTICLHINSMSQCNITKTKNFIVNNYEQFADFKSIVSLGSVDNSVTKLARYASQIILKSYRKIRVYKKEE